MSYDYHLLLDTDATPEELRKYLVETFGLTQYPNDDLGEAAVIVMVYAAEPTGIFLAEPSIGNVTIIVTFIPLLRGEESSHAMLRVGRMVVALLRRCPGDAAFTAQAERTSVLRLGDTVYIDPSQTVYVQRLLTEEDVLPARLVLGIPADSP